MAVEPLPPDMPTRLPREKLSVAWIVEETINFYRAHFFSLVTVFLVANLVTWGIQYYSGVQAERVFERHGLNLSELVENPEEAYSEAVPILIELLLLMVAIIAVLFLISLLFQSMAIRYVYDNLIGSHATWPQSLAQVLPRFPRLVATAIVAGLIVTLGLIALILPGIVLGVMFILVLHTVILEDQGPIGSLSRSNSLTSGNKWTIFFFLAFWVLVLFFFYMVVVQIVPGSWFDVMQLVAGTLFAPIIPVSTTLIYYRLSSASEG